MVAARRRVHDSGSFDAVAAAVADAATSNSPADRPAMVLDGGSGTGHYLAATLERDPGLRGLGLDLSKYCARATARSHPRTAAVVADIWRPLPVKAESVGVVLSIFSPRNVAEFARILHPAGLLVVVTPDPDHLAELVGPMRMLAVGADKDTRLHATLAADFEVGAEGHIRDRRLLDAEGVEDLVAMGPSAFHRTAEEIRSDAHALTAESDGRIEVSVSVGVTTFRPRAR
ncbi:23S rRNA (guanine(748)-N(1))-methyltransferase [Gordonia insulae]|uniref:23S rRNA (Guanine(748)-N(1))-methyltransferase n=2 Tax=Gordonia insulae TaxID=2420509 RepID=A0A3G8JUB8_9ACTN|nr:23S rRNA (guanine(748)-N(1))-methyltransferase [Gordonia insulae]